MSRYENEVCNNHGLVGLILTGKGYISRFTVEGYKIYTKIRQDLKEAKIDNLIGQRFLGLKDNEDMFYKLEELEEERVKEVTDLLGKK